MTVISLKEKSIKSVLWLGSAKFIGQFVSWLFTIILVRLLTPADFGLIGMALVFREIISILYDLNLSAAIVQKKDLTEADISTSFWFILGFSLLLYLCSWGLARPISAFFNHDSLIMIIRVLGISILIESIYLVPFWLLSRNLDFDKRAKAEFSSTFIQAVTQVLFAYLGYGVWSLVLGPIIKNCIMLIIIYNYAGWKPKAVFDLNRLIVMLKFSIPLTGAHILRLVYEQSDTIIIGKFQTPQVLGYYRVALDLSRIPVDRIMTIINHICYPTFSKLQSDTKGLRHYLSKMVGYICLLFFPLYAGGYLVAEDAIFYFLSEKWLPILFPFQIFCIIGVFQSFYKFFFMLLNSIGRTNYNFWFSLFLSLIMPISFLFGIKYGIKGICIVWLLFYPATCLSLIKCAINEIDMSFRQFFTNMFHPLCGTCFMITVVLFVQRIQPDASFFYFVITICIGCLSYISYFLCFNRSVFHEVKDIIKIAKARK